MKKILYSMLAVVMMLTTLAACSDEEVVKGGGTVLPNGDVVLSINANIPAPRQVVTRDIDPDGLGVNTLYLFCFDQFGAYIGRRDASASLQATGTSGQYTFTVEVPGSTRAIHFLSNVYLDDINAAPGVSETTLIPSIVSASGRMTYWGRVHFANENELNTFANSGHVTMYRNQAQVRWDVIGTAQEEGLQVFGYGICNRRAWGTVAAFNPDAEDGHQFDFSLDAPYVTNPAEAYQALASDPTAATVQSSEEGDPHYIFENPNTLDAPVYAVMPIGTSQQTAKYYKIMFVDDNKNQLPIYRNYEYVIRINNLPDQMGYDSFAAAKEGVAANNAWVSVDPEIPTLSDGTNTLSITNGTTQIFNAGGAQQIAFTYTGDESGVSVSWLDNDGSLSATAPTIAHAGGNNYTINMQLAQPGDEPVVGTLLLRAGVFTREIKLYLMKPFEFKPVWVSTGVPMNKGERMSMTFVIPENYPAELFPITCKIATNKMNANDDLGVQLPIVSEECEYQIANEAGATVTRRTNWGYKFVYTANEPGIQEVFFTLNVSEGSDPTGTVEGCEYAQQGVNHTHVFLEADNFTDEEKVVFFQGANSTRRMTITGAPDNNPGFLTQEVAPTVNQEVAITVNFMEEDWRGDLQASTPASGTVMRMATTVLKPDFDAYPDERNLYRNNGEATDNGIVRYYYLLPTAGSHTLHFLTSSPEVNDLVRFSVDKEAGNDDADTWYKSAGVKLNANPERFTFGNFNIVDDHESIDNVRYGLNQPVAMHFSIPQEALATTSVKFFIRTNNLKPDPSDPNAGWLEATQGGYYLNVPQGENLEARGTLHFLTTRIASAETVTISTVDNTQALFESASATFANEPVTGTLTLSGSNAPQLHEDSFITLERRNGTRVGILTVQSVDGSGVATYKLDLRSEYDFTMDETLTIYYNSLDGSGAVYEATTTFAELIDHQPGEQAPLITLVQQ